MTSLGRYHLIDKPVAVGITGAWMKGPSIGFTDLVSGRGHVEHISSAEFFGRPGPQGSATRSAKLAPSSPAKSGPVMGFGKYRDRLMRAVQADDPGYWSWALREVQGLEAKARKAGLLDKAAAEGDYDDPSDEGDGDAMTVNR